MGCSKSAPRISYGGGWRIDPTQLFCIDVDMKTRPKCLGGYKKVRAVALTTVRESSLAESPDTDLWKDSDGWSCFYKF